MLSEMDREKVKKAVETAETGLTAEIVPCVFEQSSPYHEATWGGAAAGMATGVAAILLVDWFHQLWVPASRLVLWVPAAGVVGAVLGRRFAPFKRLLIGPARMEAAVNRRAKEVFFDRGVSATAGRDGVLIFASLLERRVVVLADRAVSAKVKAGAWDATVAAMTDHARDGRVGEGLCAAVEKTASALRDAGFAGKPASGNELGDSPITGDGR